MSGRLRVGGAELAWERAGSGDPVVLVHGSWDDRRSWSGVVPGLSRSHTVVRYDRRGHSESTAPPGQGTVIEDAEDLLAVVDELAGGRAHLVGHSYGASVVLLAAARRPSAARSVVVHEPPLFASLTGDPAAEALRAEAAGWMRRAAELIEVGDAEGGARTFVEHVGFGRGAWEALFDAEARATIVANAATWLDQHRDPNRLAVDPAALAGTGVPVAVTTGTDTLPIYRAVVAALAGALPDLTVLPVEGAGHAPHLSHPAAYTALLLDRLRATG
ncbi:Pimeloyl-ACP methyl ester carboxylesterase [Streptoalloteichus tenebrarius]|uniref:Pimeloyl-ACP methyl ester carboxylesterase n=1 Tax=Streptoalloteichus tenebrarius (strain ATCC 17920 / DSM 40477 / JCM 4838 / CBS 697.72 / NBRC 16177 / NCIMB 11028 / NRRL B-12390 / A12253. 1 / ISP 5477) TaxID=1933 RepID=A0ABT1I3G6_STRSD|nr:alpha/beta hydrolase [Streptoalloteichus tenebrarius]MCP2262294.1 Pimeloyl-ACP methyl ester carboxylesterase [Streptoalloteichus tenebrarius]BFF01814.1 alpha/beta hydrolase [Streptoalloteichus tenebrarius]